MWTYNECLCDYIGKGKRVKGKLLEMRQQEAGTVFWLCDGQCILKRIKGKQTGHAGSQTKTSMRLLSLNDLWPSGIKPENV